MTMSPIRRQKLFRNGSQPSSETSWVVNPEHFAQNQVVNDGRRSGADQRDAPRCGASNPEACAALTSHWTRPKRPPPRAKSGRSAWEPTRLRKPQRCAIVTGRVSFIGFTDAVSRVWIKAGRVSVWNMSLREPLPRSTANRDEGELNSGRTAQSPLDAGVASTRGAAWRQPPVCDFCKCTTRAASVIWAGISRPSICCWLSSTMS